MALARGTVFNTFWRLKPTFARIAGIVAGSYIMGPHAFARFYLVHMLLKSLKILFFFDADMNIFQTIRKEKKIRWRHFSYIIAWNAGLCLMVLVVYLGAIEFFDRFVSIDLIDVDFAYVYALTIVGNLLVPYEGVIKAKGGYWLKSIALRGMHLINLALIGGFVLAGFDGANLPYVWLSTSMIMAVLVFGAGVYLLHGVIDRGNRAPLGRALRDSIWQNVIDYSASRSRNRAVTVATRGAISAVLGPFAGLALQAIHFGDEVKRKKYMAMLKTKSLVRQATNRIPRSVTRALTRDRLFGVVLVVALLILAFIVPLRNQMDALMLLGLLVLASKLLSVALRVLVLKALTSNDAKLLISEESEANTL